MAVITISAASVSIPNYSLVKRAISGVALNAGQWCYKDASADSVLKLAEAGETAAKADCVAFIVSGCDAAGQPVDYIDISGIEITIGSVLTTTPTIYVLSATAGKMGLYSDLVSTDYLTILGYSNASATVLVSLMKTTGKQIP